MDLIKITHWNLGLCHWRNKVLDIQLLLDQHKPELAFISEANLHSTTSDAERNIQ